MKSWISSRSEAMKTIGAWLACFLLLCGTWLGSILFFLASAQRANSIRLTATGIRIQELEARRAEKDFILRSLGGQAFFQDGRSSYLERHDVMLAGLRAEIEHLSEQVPAAQKARTLHLLDMVDRYERGFRKLVAGYRKRGSRQWGLEGSLRSAFAKVEEAVRLSDESALEQAVLRFSRAHGSFLAARGPENAEQVTAAVALLRQGVLKEEASEGLLDAIDQYEAAFAELSALERRIGLTEDLGLQGELREAIHAVEPVVEEILADAVRADEEANRTLMVGLFVACFIMAILLALAILFAQSARLHSKRLLQTNQQMEEDHRKLLRSERLAAIGQMVAGLAHESRNAFQRTHACLDMLSQEVKDRPEALALVSRIEESQDYIHLLYEQVREYAAPLQMKRASVRLDEVVRSAREHLELLCEGRNVRFEQHANGVDLRCDVDAFAVDQVFRNIFENSLSACEGSVEINVCYRERRASSESMLEVSVSDNGPGLDAEQSAKIFDPFYTTKTRGTGLGMAIAKRLVEAHSGTIEVGSRRGPGAEIVVSFPRRA